MIIFTIIYFYSIKQSLEKPWVLFFFLILHAIMLTISIIVIIVWLFCIFIVVVVFVFVAVVVKVIVLFYITRFFSLVIILMTAICCRLDIFLRVANAIISRIPILLGFLSVFHIMRLVTEFIKIAIIFLIIIITIIEMHIFIFPCFIIVMSLWILFLTIKRIIFKINILSIHFRITLIHLFSLNLCIPHFLVSFINITHKLIHFTVLKCFKLHSIICSLLVFT